MNTRLASLDTQENDQIAQELSRPRSKHALLFAALALLVAVILTTLLYVYYYSDRVSTDDAQIDGHLDPISPQISGNLLDVLVNDNQEVHPGDELLRIDPADYQVALAQAQAKLFSSQAAMRESQINIPLSAINLDNQVKMSHTQLQQASAAVTSTQEALNAARAQLAAAYAALAQRQATARKTQADLSRYQELFKAGIVSKQDYDAAVASSEAETAQVESAKAAANAAHHNVDQASAELAEATARRESAVLQHNLSRQVQPKQEAIARSRYEESEAAVRQSRADVDRALLNLRYTVIRAPIHGVVSRKIAEPGMHVSPGQQLLVLIPLDDIWVTGNFKETQLKGMRVGQKVTVQVDTYGRSRIYRAHIDSIAAASGDRFSLLPAENATGNYVKVVQRVPVKIVLEPGENPDRTLRPGMSVIPTVFLNGN